MAQGVKRTSIETRRCVCCDAEFSRNKKYSAKQWSTALWCSRKCSTWNKGVTKNDDPRMQSIADQVRISSRGRPGWSKGLTKETHPSLAIVSRKVSIAQRGKKINEAQRAGLVIGQTWAKGRTKENCSIIARKAKHLSKIYTGVARPKCSAQKKAYYAANPEKHPNAILAKKTKGRGYTYIEKIVSDILSEMNVTFDFNVNVGNKWPDFSIPSIRLIIEADGEYWHQDAEKEAKRDAYLQSLGWRVEHFSGKSLINDTVGCCDRISALFVECSA